MGPAEIMSKSRFASLPSQLSRPRMTVQLADRHVSRCTGLDGGFVTILLYIGVLLLCCDTRRVATTSGFNWDDKLCKILQYPFCSSQGAGSILRVVSQSNNIARFCKSNARCCALTRTTQKLGLSLFRPEIASSSFPGWTLHKLVHVNRD
jgi:hypothetical protein